MCDAGAIRFKPTLGGVTSPALDLSLCTGCGACVAPCPTQAISMKTPAGSAG
jgi:ferredoxin-type protein NapF